MNNRMILVPDRTQSIKLTIQEGLVVIHGYATLLLLHMKSWEFYAPCLYLRYVLISSDT